MINEGLQKWSNIINEEYGVKGQKLAWMSQYAQNHELYEGQQTTGTNVSAGIYATPLNTMGMGNVAFPGVQNGDGGQNPSAGGYLGQFQQNGTYLGQTSGSGDIPMSTLTMSLEIAAVTIGLELVPVIPVNTPFPILSYMDFPYAGGKYDRIGNLTGIDGKGPKAENKPIYIKVPATITKYFGATYNIYDGGSATPTNQDIETISFVYNKKDIPAGFVGTVMTFANETNVKLEGEFIGFSRIDNAIIVKVLGCKGASDSDYSSSVSIAEVFDGSKIKVSIASSSNPLVVNPLAGHINWSYSESEGKWTKVGPVAAESTLFSSTTINATLVDSEEVGQAVKADLVAAAADHVQGFSNFFDGSQDPMSRAENETGVGNTIGARVFTKRVNLGSYEVTGTVTRQQLQDMPLLGVDVIGKVLESMQNEISQSINNRILDRVFRLGVDNAINQYNYQGVNLNLYLNDVNGAGLKLNQFSGWNKYQGLNQSDAARNTFGNAIVPNAIQNTAAENVSTHQRRIMSRLLASANLIANVSRRGRAQWAVTNTYILSALQDVAGFVIAPMDNTLTQNGSNSLYFAGSVAGLSLYVDPYMTWDDTRVCVGRKSTGNDPGVIFMPYILADTVQTIAEGTMAPKLLVNSRFAIVDAGFHPEQSYYTFMVQTSDAGDFLI